MQSIKYMCISLCNKQQWQCLDSDFNIIWLLLHLIYRSYFLHQASLCSTIFVFWSLTLFRMGRGRGGKRASPTSFSPVTSTNVGFGPQNFLTFSFNPFATLVRNFKFVPSASPKLWNLNQDHHSKKAIFLVESL